MSKYQPHALVLAAALVLVSAPEVFAQGNASADRNPPAKPVVTGFVTAKTSPFSEKKLESGLTLIFLAPTWGNGLFLAELESGYTLKREDGMWEREFEYELEYLQLNQRVFKNHTFVAGKFLTPGTWNERLHPAWIKKTPDAPFTAGLFPGSGTGVMLRGVIPLGTNANLTYSPFATTTIDNKYFESERMAGGRIGTFFKTRGFDVGFLAARTLGEEPANIYGIDFTYQMRARAIDLRGEYFSGHDGSAYWLEIAKRFKGMPGLLRRFEAVGRFEQAFVGSDMHDDGEAEGEEHGEMMTEDKDHGDEEMPKTEEGHGHGTFPEANSSRFVGTLNYYVRDGFKLYTSYGREVASGMSGRQNVLSFGLAFRF